jgi:hypothetical protein
MPVTRHPPHRSVRARLCIRLLPRMSGGKALLRIGVSCAACRTSHTPWDTRTPALCLARARVRDVFLGLHPFRPNLRRRWHSVVRLVHRDSGAVRPLQAVHGRHTALRLRAPVSAAGDPRHPGGLPVLVHVASRRAETLRLRRVDEPLASHATRRVAFPLRGMGSAPWRNFSKLHRPARRCPCLRFTRHLAMPPARLRVRIESLAPFLQGSCIPCNLPVYPGAPPGLEMRSHRTPPVRTAKTCGANRRLPFESQLESVKKAGTTSSPRGSRVLGSNGTEKSLSGSGDLLQVGGR